MHAWLIFLCILAIPAGIYLLLKPRLSFLLAIFFLPAHNLAFDIGIQIELYYLFLLFSLAGCSAQYLLAKRPFIKLPYDNFFLYFCIAAILSSIVGYFLLSENPFPMIGGALRGPLLRPLVQQVRLWFIVGSYLLTINLIRDEKSIVKVVNVLLLSSLSACLYGIYQFVGFYLHLPFVMGIKELAKSGAFRAPAEYLGVMRISSYVGEPKQLAAFLLPVLVVMIVIFCFKTKSYFWGKQLLLKILFLLCFGVFLLTFSRGAVVALLITLFVVIPFTLICFVKKRRPLYLYSKVVITSLILTIILSAGITRFKGGDVSSLLYRRLMSINEILSEKYATNVEIKFALNLVKRFPLTGVGLGNFTYYYLPEYSNRAYTYGGLYRVETSPIWFLSTLVETGILGLIFLLLFLCCSIKYAVRVLKNTSIDFCRENIAIFLVPCISYLVYSLYIGGPHFVFFIYLGMLKSSVRLALRSENLPGTQGILCQRKL